MYFLNSLDRSNLGNAKTDGLDGDLPLRGNQYSIILAVFNVTFCLFDLPSNLLLKRYSGKASHAANYDAGMVRGAAFLLRLQK